MSANPPASDEDLIALILTGDDGAFEVLYSRYAVKVFRYAYGMTGNQETAEDLTQEIFVQVFGKLVTFRGQASFRTWLFRITRNHCLNSLRGKTAPLENIEDVDEKRIHHLRPVDSPDELLLQKEIQSDVLKGLLKLPPRHREWIILHDLMGLGYEELAELFNCSSGYVGSTLFKARKRLAQILSHLKGQI